MGERRFTLEELEKCDGAEGRQTCVAYKGRVVDLSQSKLWRGGQHMRRHKAGADLTEELKEAPHGAEVLDRHPTIGTMEAPGAEPEPERQVPALIRHYPFLKRHPHPMTVHFPIVFTLAAVAFTLIASISGSLEYDIEAFHLLLAAILFTPVAMATGVYSWWLNYMARPITPVRRKLVLAPILLILQASCAIWRYMDPTVVLERSGAGIAYVLLVLLMAPLVGLIGWYGANMTFPLHE